MHVFTRLCVIFWLVVVLERRMVDGDGEVVGEWPERWADGRTHDGHPPPVDAAWPDGDNDIGKTFIQLNSLNCS